MIAFPSIGDSSTRRSIPGLTEQPDFSYTDLFATLDTRDQPGNARAGQLHRRPVAALQRPRFRSLQLRPGRPRRPAVPADLRQEARPRASRPAADVHGRGDGQIVPFYFQPTLGGSTSLRSASDFRYRDENVLATTSSTAGRRSRVWTWRCSRISARLPTRSATSSLGDAAERLRHRAALQYLQGRVLPDRRRRRRPGRHPRLLQVLQGVLTDAHLARVSALCCWRSARCCPAPGRSSIATIRCGGTRRRRTRPSPSRSTSASSTTSSRTRSSMPGTKTRRRAVNVNTVDEVPDSSWFTNRIGRDAVDDGTARRGPGHGQRPGAGSVDDHRREVRRASRPG